MRWRWTCCGITSGGFRKHSAYVQSALNHKRWFHWGEDCGRSSYSIGFTR